MFRSFFLCKKWLLWSWGGSFLILAILLIVTRYEVLLNDWYKGFYDILQQAPKSTYQDFLNSFKQFIYLVVPLILLSSFNQFFTRHFALSWREAITFSYLQAWRKHNDYIEGASQRIQEDIFNFAKIVENLGIKFAGSLMTLVAFTPILYALGKDLIIPVFSAQSGLLIWALISSVGGIFISWLVGIRLPHLEYDNQKAEAAFRKELVFAENDRVNYAGAGVVFELFTGIRLNYRKLYLHLTYFDLWIGSYAQFMVIFAYIIVGKNLFLGIITFGIFMQINNAFGNVHAGFSVIMRNWTLITELRSIYRRLNEFENHINYHKA